MTADSQLGIVDRPTTRRDSARQKSVAETLLSPSILEAIPDALVAVNRQGVIIQVNSQTEAPFSYTRTPARDCRCYL